MYTVYCHIFPNGKRYVGITKTTVERRWGGGRGYATCPLMSRAIEKYGWENIKHEILYTDLAKDMAEQMERELISLYRTSDPKHGYNILPGGDVSDGITDEVRVKLGNGMRGKHHSDETKAKIGAVQKGKRAGEKHPLYGKSASEETRKRMSGSQKRNWDNSPERKMNAQSRMRERMANPEYRKAVRDNLSAYRRKKGEWTMPDTAKEKLSAINKGRWIGEKSPSSKPVLQYTKDGVFVKRWANACEVERAGIAKRSNIAKCCRGVPHCKTAGGFLWRYDSEAS